MVNLSLIKFISSFPPPSLFDAMFVEFWGWQVPGYDDDAHVQYTASGVNKVKHVVFDTIHQFLVEPPINWQISNIGNFVFHFKDILPHIYYIFIQEKTMT